MGLRSLVQAQDGVVTTAQLRAAGVSRAVERGHVEAGRWIRLHRGVLLVDPGRLARNQGWVAARAAVLAVPGSVVAGRTAARLYGLDGVPDGPEEVLVPCGRALRVRPGLAAHRCALAVSEVRLLREMRVTSPGRTVTDVVLRSDRSTALAVMDSALRRGLVDPAELGRLRDASTGRPGSASVRDLWARADGRAESVLESRVRLRCLEGGWPPDELQLVVTDDDGGHVGRADMAFRRRGRTGWLLVEADGAGVHGSPDALFRDRSRANALTALGHQLLRFTWRDTLDPYSVPRAVGAALRQRG